MSIEMKAKTITGSNGMMTRPWAGSTQRSAGQGAYTLSAIPGIDFPVLRPVERWRPYAGTRGQRGHGGRDGLIWLGKGRPRGCRVFLLWITQGRTGQRDTWCHHACWGLSPSGWEFWPGGQSERSVHKLSKGDRHDQHSHGSWVGLALWTLGHLRG